MSNVAVLGKRQIMALPSELKSSLLEAAWYLHNITDIEWPTGGRSYPCPTIVPAKKPGERYASVEVVAGFPLVDMGDNRSVESSVSAELCAKDLAAGINGNVGGEAFESFNGVFASPNARPTEAELSAAEKKLTGFYTEMVREADKSWMTYHRMEFISGLMLRAAQHLKLDRDWCSTIKPQIECPSCGSLVKPGVAMCRDCGAILDAEKYAKYHPAEQTATEPETEETEAKPRTRKP